MRKDRRFREAFSLPEMLLVSGIMITVAGFMALTPAPARNRANVDGLAYDLQAELVKARQLALARHEPVAIGFPTNLGTTGITNQMYRLEGHRARLSRVIDFSKTHPNTSMFSGYYPSGGSSWVQGGAVRGIPTGGFDTTFAAWPDPAPDDPKLIFTPAGTVVSKSPRLDGFHTVVCSQSQHCYMSSLFGNPIFKMGNVMRPVTVQISPLGSVQVTNGLPGGGNWLLVDSPVNVTDPLGLTPVGLGGNPGPPVADNVTISPPPVMALPAGVNGTVVVGQSVHLEATCAERGDLLGYANVTTPNGLVTLANKKPLEWDTISNQHRFSFEFQTNSNDPPGTDYDVTMVITTKNGTIASWPSGSTRRLRAVKKQPVLWQSQRTGAFQIMRCEEDGSNPVRLSDSTGDDQGARWAPDGSKFLFHSNRSGTWGLYTAQPDGSGVRPVIVGPNLAGQEVAPMGACWSGDGTQIAVPAANGWWYVVQADGSNARKIYFQSTAAPEYLDWHPTGPWVIGSDGTQIICADTSAPSWTNVTLLDDPALTQKGQPSFSPDGTKIAYSSGDDIWYGDFAPVNGGLTGLINLTSSGDQENRPCWAPDGSSLLVDAFSSNCTIYRYFLSMPGVRKDFIDFAGCDNYPDWGRHY